MRHLLARFAESIFWLARYMERTENLARILDVQDTFSRDSRGLQNWLSVLQINADEKRFLERYEEAARQDVLQFYALDDENPNSILSNLRVVRENARTLRPLISTEMWQHANVFYNRMRQYRDDPASVPPLQRLCTWIKESCQAHEGIVEGTFYRDEGWYFYQIGKYLERADNTTRILDIKYHVLLPSPDDVGSPLDASQWNALLRSVAGYHAFRRVHPRGMQPAKVADFLLFNPRFPRSVHRCVDAAERFLAQVRGAYGLRGGAAALERLDELRAVLDSRDGEKVISRGLHEFNDWLQSQLNAVTNDLSADIFNSVPVEPDAAAPETEEATADEAPAQVQMQGAEVQGRAAR